VVVDTNGVSCEVVPASGGERNEGCRLDQWGGHLTALGQLHDMYAEPEASLEPLDMAGGL
jgi:hypothetical protein